MKKYLIEVVSGERREIVTTNAETIEEARERAVEICKGVEPDLEWDDASSAEIPSDSTHTS